MGKSKDESWIIYMGTFPPRECGIATFTKDLVSAMNKKFSPIIKSKILAINRGTIETYNYPKDVLFEISDTDIQEYIDVANEINQIEKIKLINIQHEFGLFGGKSGNYLISFLKIIKKPVIITFHTVLPNPDEEFKKLVQLISNFSTCLIVMNNKAIEILKNNYNITKDIVMIPHGIPSVPFHKSSKEKLKMGLNDKIILSSFGMMNKGKGYEYVIEALPKVVKKFPNVLYLIIGETHPVVRKKEGEEYRNFLEDKVKELGLENNVKFYNKYLRLKEIISYLKATDIYLSSGLNPNQITSGTLSYAMGCGRAVISTPFLHAINSINVHTGLLVKFKDSNSFTDAIMKLLLDKKLKETLEKNSYTNTRPMIWSNVAISYKKTFDKYIKLSNKDTINLTGIKFNQLIKLTDNFGIIQFAKGTDPDTTTGYTLDDNARALIACCKFNKYIKNSTYLELIEIYLEFISYVQEEDGKLYNYVDYSKKINKDEWINDPQGRAIWALGYLISIKTIPNKFKEKAEKILIKSLESINEIKSPRANAFIILGLYFYNKSKESNKNLDIIKKCANHLASLYEDSSSEKWSWFEGYLTYSNSKLPEAMFYAYIITKDKKYLKIAKSSLNFLSSITFENKKFIPIGHDGWYFKNAKRSYYDQQPVDVASMVQTLILAYKITKDEIYKKNAMIAFEWFIGKNSLNQVIYNEDTGGCHDGIGKYSINLNQGAESTISYLIARLSMEEFENI